MKNRYILFLILILWSFIADAQPWKDDLLAMNKTYMESKNFRMNIQVNTYEYEKDVKPISVYKGSVASSNGNYCTVIMGKTTIYNKRCALVVDDAQKIILYKKNKTEASHQNFFAIANIDSAMIFFGKNVDISYLVNNEKEKRIEIKYKNNAIEKMEIAINASDNTLKQIVYHYTSRPQMGMQSIARVTVDYSEVEVNKNIAEVTFSENKFIVVKKEKIAPTDLYKKYEVIDQSATQTP